MNTYETAISEYEFENEDGQHKLIYSYFGLAIYFSQCLEQIEFLVRILKLIKR